MFSFIIGLLIGGLIGITVSAICRMASEVIAERGE